MPREMTRLMKSEGVQGKDSFVRFRKLTFGEIKALQDESKANEGDTKWSLERSERLLKDHIVSWNWTGEDDNPLPLPKDDPDVINSLTDDEIKFLSECLNSPTSG